MAKSVFLLFLAALSFLLAIPVFSLISSPQNDFRISLKHVDAGRNLTKSQLIRRAISRSNSRLEKLSSNTTDVLAPVHGGSGEYLMNLSIGTPSLPFLAIMDTGSDLIWTQCQPCIRCFDQPTPVFDPVKSQTFINVSCASDFCKDLSTFKCENGCQYLYSYGDSSSTQGYLAFDTFTLGDSSKQIPLAGIAFGCGVQNKGRGFGQGAGLVGLGRGPLSLVSQLGAAKFSYCLTTVGQNQSSSLLFGSLAELNFTRRNFKGTPLVRSSARPSFYYINLEGITVGETLLPLPESVFELKENGDGGMIIDSGTTITYLENDAFKVVKQAFTSQIKLRVSESHDSGLDLCFDLPKGYQFSNADVPKLTFHFKGLDLELPGENYMLSLPELELICLGMAGTDSISIFGNIQQQNMLVLHDLEKETVSFVPTQCNNM